MPAQEVVKAAWALLQKSGWNHPAWREAYSLGQLCSAAAHLSMHNSHTLTPLADTATTAALQHQNSSITPEQHISVRTAALQTPQAVACPSMQAMQALDLASIMGAPAEFLGAVLDAVEPKARQDHQAMYSQQTAKASSDSSHQHCTSSPADPDQFALSSNNCEPQEQQTQQDLSRQSKNGSEQRDCKGRAAGLGRSPSLPSQQLPTLQPEKAIARRNVKDLTAAEFKKQYWKTDTPVIITGMIH